MPVDTIPTAGQTELTLTREVPISAEQMFRTWRDRLGDWFAPKPLTTEILEFDFRSGGAIRTIMHDPAGTDYPTSGVFLEIIEDRRIVMTDAYSADWTPNPELFFTAVITFDPLPNGGCLYTAKARHWTEENCRKHAEMGFTQGWSLVLDQLVAIAAEKKSE